METLAAIAPDGKAVLVAAERAARVWDAGTWEPLTPELSPHQIADIAFSRDGKRVLTVGDRWARVWDARTGERLSPRLSHAVGARIYYAELSPDGERLLTVAAEPPDPKPGIKVEINPQLPKVTDTEGEVRIWEVQTGEMCVAMRHPSFVQCTFQPRRPPGSHHEYADDGLRLRVGRLHGCFGTAADQGDVGRRTARGFRRRRVAVRGHRLVQGRGLLHPNRQVAPRRRRLQVPLPAHFRGPFAGRQNRLHDQQGADARGWDVDTGKEVVSEMKDVSSRRRAVRSEGRADVRAGLRFQRCRNLGPGATGKRLWSVPEKLHDFHAAHFAEDGSVLMARPATAVSTSYVYRLTRK